MSLRYLHSGVNKGVATESDGKLIVPPHKKHGEKLGDGGRNHYVASDLGVLFYEFRHCSQAFGLVGKRGLDGFEIVSCDSDGDDANNCARVTRQQIEK